MRAVVLLCAASIYLRSSREVWIIYFRGIAGDRLRPAGRGIRGRRTGWSSSAEGKVAWWRSPSRSTRSSSLTWIQIEGGKDGTLSYTKWGPAKIQPALWSRSVCEHPKKKEDILYRPTGWKIRKYLERTDRARFVDWPILRPLCCFQTS